MNEKVGLPRYHDVYARDPLVEQNAFRIKKPDLSSPPSFADSRHLLPQPYGNLLDSEIACYWKAWELAFANLKAVSPENGFISPFIDTAFNNCLFMWDSAFILMFARYGSRAFNFQKTLDNFYAKQHADGFICREIHEWDGQDQFHRYDPGSTGPNVLPWCEWEYYCNFGDRQRLAEVFAPLLAYHRWMRSWRTWPDGSYWSNGWGCGMDNQPRLEPGLVAHINHGHMSWIDATAQAVLSGRVLLAMAKTLDRAGEVRDLGDEVQTLKNHINQFMWDEQTNFYGDRRRDGSISQVKTIGAYWTLLAEIVPEDRLEGFISHLRNPRTFNRPHRIPSLSADHPEYRADGGYWRGGVWPPTNYMALRGLTRNGCDDLAYEIGLNHVAAVTKVFQNTQTLWENYAPETVAAGGWAKGDFVGWGGLGPIAVLLEYVMGIRADVPNATLTWDIRLTAEHGIRQYPYGAAGLLDLHVQRRSDPTQSPEVKIKTTLPLTVQLSWPGGGRRTLQVVPQT